jgi:hypothetical protein
MMNFEQKLNYVGLASLHVLFFWIFLLGLMFDATGVIVVTFIFALAHFVKFTWQVPLLCIPFGLVLGFSYLIISHPYNAVAVLIIHVAIATVAWGWIKRFMRSKKEKRYYA